MEISKVSDVSQETVSQTRNFTGFNLVGIVPVEDGENHFGLPWADCLVPVAENYLAFERAVVEAAAVGCDSIWVVSYGGIGELFKDRLGEWIREPHKEQLYEKQMQSRIKKIPIYYVQLKSAPGNLLTWSILQMANVVYSVHKKMSQWVAPDRYYVSFPFGVYPHEALLDFRKDIKNRNGFFISHNDRTVKDGEHLGFTFNNNELIEFQKIYASCVENSIDPSPEKVFGSRDMIFWEREITEVAVPFYHNIGTWERYRLFLGSEDAKDIVRPDLRTLPRGTSRTKRIWKGMY